MTLKWEQDSAARPQLRVLVVEDEPLLQWAVSEALSSAGHVAAQASDGASARQALAVAGPPFDVVLLDLCLPDCRDLTLLSSIRHLSPATAVVMMTAHGTPATVDEARRLGVSAVLDKPFDLDRLHGILVGACEAHQCRSERGASGVARPGCAPRW